jgi:hypothetical protein
VLLSDKYVAGFLDGDGSVWVQEFVYSSGQTGRRLFIEMCQKAERGGGVIEAIAQWLPGGTLDEQKGRRRGVATRATRLRYSGQRAVDVLCRLKPYLVTKRVRANRLLRELGFTERVGTDSVPVHPSRKWLAGYFDADGCVYAGVNRNGGSANLQFSIDAGSDEKAGIELVQKAFGGVLRVRGDTGNCWRWEMKADAAKAKAFLPYFAQHLVLKKEQAYFVLGCAEMGHFRDGQTISDTLKVMKARPHRLNDLAAEVDVSAAVALVRNLQSSPGKRYWSLPKQTCYCCGATKIYAKGLCNPCWQAARYYAFSAPSRRNSVPDALLRSKRQSELAVS